MLENISGYGVDYAKFWIELTGPEYSVVLPHWLDVFEGMTGPQGGEVYRVHSEKRGERENAFYYSFEVWGDAAQLVDQLDFEAWYPYLDRLDLKTIMPMTVEGQKNYLGYLEDKVADKRNFGWLNSRHRQKRNGRDAGGHGLYIGSHKSDFRCQWTMRGDEDGYQEFQLTGTRINSAKEFQRLVAGQHPDYMERRGWVHLCRDILRDANIELSQLDGLYDTDRAAILSGREDIHHIMETKLQYIEGYLNRLPKDALFGVYRALELKLFGETPSDDDDDDDDHDMLRLAQMGE